MTKATPEQINQLVELAFSIRKLSRDSQPYVDANWVISCGTSLTDPRVMEWSIGNVALEVDGWEFAQALITFERSRRL